MNVLRQLIRCILAEDGKWGKFAFGQARQKDEPDTEEEKKAYFDIESWIDGSRIPANTTKNIVKLADLYPDVLRPPKDAKYAYRVISLRAGKHASWLGDIPLPGEVKKAVYTHSGKTSNVASRGVSSWSISPNAIENFVWSDIFPSGRHSYMRGHLIIMRAPIKGNRFYLNPYEIPTLRYKNEHEVLLIGSAHVDVEAIRFTDINSGEYLPSELLYDND